MRLVISDIKIPQLPALPGVYLFWNQKNHLLYVGKAGKLRNRLSSYFRTNLDSPKTKKLMEQAAELEYIVANSDNEALLLESNLIKQHRPPFNVIFKDDKSYPYIHITKHRFPQIRFHRGKQSQPGDYYGPFASSHAVRETLKTVQKIFPIRPCDDLFFSNRSRPCLQHQIKLCSAPCVGLIDEPNYAQNVQKVQALFSAKDDSLLRQLKKDMMKKSADLQYEQASLIRDQIRQLQQVLEQQSVNAHQVKSDIDVISVGELNQKVCVQITFVRKGWQYGSKTIWLKHHKHETAPAILEAFISQYYQQMPVPNELVFEIQPNNADLLQLFLDQKRGTKVRMSHRSRGARLRWLESTQFNAQQSLIRVVDSDALAAERLKKLRLLLNTDSPLDYIECFDISHTMGQGTKGSCVVFRQARPSNKDYRIMNLEGITPGDDYAAIRQVVKRRYRRLSQSHSELPSLIIVDGGKGQGNMAKQALEEENIQNVILLAVAKGVDRKAGEETLWLPLENNRELRTESDDGALHVIQYIRDEAHRFAISGHRAKYTKKSLHSELEDIPGVGRKTRQRLIEQFGGIRDIKKMGINELSQTKGVSRSLAEKIFYYYHQ